jgi:hypothetical protein
MTIKQQGGIFGRNPTFNDVDIEGTLTVNGEPISDFGTMATQDASSVAITGGSGAFDTFTVDTDTLYVDAPSDRVGINTSSPTTALQVNTGAGGFGTFMHTSGVGGLRISGAAGASGANLVLANNFNTALDDRWAFSLNGGTDALSIASGGVASGLGGSGTERVTVDTSGNMSLKTGNLVVASGQGIDFSATSGTGTSELFDDYEEGTWTPVLSDGTNNATMSANSAGSYTKIGRLIVLNASVETTSLGSVTGAIRITGLPYSNLTGTPFYASGVAGYGELLNITAGQSVGLAINSGNAHINLNLWDAAGGISPMQASEWSADGVITFSISYFGA